MIDSLKTLFRSFMAICLFRLGPQDLPASNFLLTIIFGITAITSLLLNLVMHSIQEAALVTILNLAVVAIITQFILRLYNKPHRFAQTLCALLGTGIIISIFALPVLVMLAYANQHDVNISSGIFLWLMLLIWEIAVSAHILRNTLACSLTQGFITAVIYPLIFFPLANLLIPAP